VKIEYDGRAWDFDVEDIPVSQCEAVEKYVPSKGMGDWYNQLDAGHTRAVIALWWVLRKRAGEAGAISQPGDDFRPLRLLSAFNAALRAEAEAAAAAEAEAEAEPDPTTPAVSSPAPSAATTMTTGVAPATLSLPG